MRTELFSKILVLGVIVLFVGVSVASSSPSLSMSKSKISTTFKINESQSISLINNDLIVTLETDKERYDKSFQEFLRKFE